MNDKRFAELAAAYGAERRRWPQAERAVYDAFAGTPEGLALLADRRLPGGRQVLAAGRSGPVGGEDPDGVRQTHQLALDRVVELAWLSTGFAACALLGFVLGFMQVSADSDEAQLYDLLLGSSTIEELL